MNEETCNAVRMLLELGKDHHLEEEAALAEHYLDCKFASEEEPCPHGLASLTD